MCINFFFQAEDGIRDLVRSRGLGDVYKRQENGYVVAPGEVPGFADRLAELARDPALVSRMSYAAHRAVHDLSLIHI